MAVTKEQLVDLGFVKVKRQQYGGHHYTLLFRINDSDYIFSGYDKVTKKTNFKILWMSKKLPSGERVTFPLEKLGNLSYTKVKMYLEDIKRIEEHKNAGNNQ